jgi:hypothetical protein
MSDYNLWRIYWMAAMYGAGQKKRMEAVDTARRKS